MGSLPLLLAKMLAKGVESYRRASTQPRESTRVNRRRSRTDERYQCSVVRA